MLLIAKDNDDVAQKTKPLQ